MASDKASPRLPQVPTPEAQKPKVLVKLQGNYLSNYEGEIIGVDAAEADRLLKSRFGSDHPKRGQPYAVAPSAEEMKQISDVAAWQAENTKKAQAQQLQDAAGIFALAMKGSQGSK